TFLEGGLLEKTRSHFKRKARSIMGINYKQCPKCGSKNTLKILYGMPTREVFQKQKQEKLN
ncbi:hypothetical protein ABEW70_15885, partial [Heyndrickxia faecalis]